MFSFEHNKEPRRAKRRFGHCVSGSRLALFGSRIRVCFETETQPAKARRSEILELEAKLVKSRLLRGANHQVRARILPRHESCT